MQAYYKSFLLKLCLLAGLCLFPLSGNAQQVKSSGSLLQHAFHPDPAHPLENDSRLLVKITADRKEVSVDEALRILSKGTDLKLITHSLELANQHVAFHYASTPLKAILDSVAAAVNGEWAWQDKTTLALRTRYNAHQFDVYRPHSPAEAERFRLGRQFADAFNQLPDAQQQAFANRNTDGGAFTNLSSAMQELIRGMLQAKQEDLARDNFPRQLDPNNLKDASIRVDALDRQDGVDFFRVQISGANQSIDLSFPIFQDPRDQQDDRVVSLEEANAAQGYNPVADDTISRAKALALDKRLNQKVTFKFSAVTLPEALRQLCLLTQTQIDFVAQPDIHRPALRKTLTFVATPVKDILDHFAAQYSYVLEGAYYRFTWGERDSGVLEFHFSANEVPATNSQ